ncbi:MAG: type II toxin-antitoxin system RelE/ParE family toxin [Pseudomonadales bacterium]
MARLIYSQQAFADLDRLTDFLLQTEPTAVTETIHLITEAIQILNNHPLIGRAVEQELRELVISRGQSGYLALYSYEQKEDVVLILAIHHQREAGYTPD